MKQMYNYINKMRLLLLAAILPMCSFGLHAQDLSEGLVAYWSFDNNNFQDEGPNAKYNGEGMGADPIEFGSGPGAAFGDALILNGVDQYVQITGGETDELSFSQSSSVDENATGKMSVSTWFRVESFDVDWQALIAQGEGGRWRIHRSGGTTVMAVAGGNGDTPAEGPDISDGEWHHLVAVVDVDGLTDQDGFSAIYIDGEVAAVNTAASTLEVNPSDLQIMIGENPDARGRYWNGGIDDVAIWRRALSDAEVRQLYAGGTGMPVNALFVKETTIELLGVGADNLIGGDLTDPENDGDEAGEDMASGWNWVSIESNIEPGFGGGEFSYNIFDNAVGGGNDKWCCDDPTDDNPYWVAVQFEKPVALTHFTITSGNDSADRDPIRWAIQGSNDGESYSDIYNYNEETSFFTDRNQVALIDLAETSAPYTYLRYIVYHTPGTLHQINEIEYFGCFGGCGNPVLAGTAREIDSFGVRVKDGTDNQLDPNSVQLTIDGKLVSHTLSKAGDTTTITYTPDSRFPSNSDHTWALSALDTAGNAIEGSGKWTTDLYGYLAAGSKVNPDTSKPGFKIEIHQNEAFQDNNHQRALDQLNGVLGENLADPFFFYAELGEGEPGSADLPVGYTGVITFETDGVINYNQDDGVDIGEIGGDSGIPGVPGFTGSNNGIAGRFTTFVELPAGEHTFIVNSDDGFFTSVGVPGDIFSSSVAGEFEGGRGAADTAFPIFVDEDGVYPITTVWYEGGGGANIEIKTEMADGTRVLVNDTANGGFASYRATVDGNPAIVTSVTPGINDNNALPDANIVAFIQDGDVSVDGNSVSMKVDGADVSTDVSSSDGLTTVTFDRGGALWAPGQHVDVELTYTAGSLTRTVNWGFDVSEIFGPAVSADIITRGLVAYWSFDNEDFSDGKGVYNGESRGEVPVAFSAGQADFGQAITLDGIDQYVEITGGTADDLAFEGGPMTVSSWFRVGAFDKSWQALVAKGEGNNWRVARRSGETGVAIAAGNGDTPTATGAGADVSDGEWHHLVGVANGPYGSMLYIDGEVVATNTAPSNLTRNGSNMMIGENPGAAGRSWNGDIDDVALWNRPLSAEEVAALYNNGAGTPVGNWDLNPAPVIGGGITSVGLADGSVVIEFGGTLKSSESVTGPFAPVAGAASPYSVAPSKAAEFYIAE